MSNQPPPPARGKAPPPAQQGRSQAKAGSDARRAAPARRPKPAWQSAPADPGQKAGIEPEQAVVTAGQNGEQNLHIERVEVKLAPNITSHFYDVTSLPGHRLAAETEQGTYRKSYAATGQFRTEPSPAAPHGTPGKLVVRDLETGEVLEQGWCWRWWGGDGGGLFSWLFGLVRKLFAKPKG